MAAITAHRYLRGLPSAPPPWWVSVGVGAPPLSHWVAVTLIKERDGAPAWMAPLYNVTGGSQDGSAGGGNTASVSQGGGGGGFPRCRASSSFPDFARITMTTGNSGYPGTHSHLEKRKTSLASLHAAALMLAEFGVSLRPRGGWRGGVWARRLRNKHAKPPSPSVSSLLPRLGRISEESAEFFERVNGVLQKQQNMLQAAQAEVTSTRAATAPSVTCFKLRPRRRGGGGC